MANVITEVIQCEKRPSRPAETRSAAVGADAQPSAPDAAKSNLARPAGILAAPSDAPSAPAGRFPVARVVPCCTECWRDVPDCRCTMRRICTCGTVDCFCDVVVTGEA